MASPIALAKAGIAKIKSAAKSFGDTVAASSFGQYVSSQITPITRVAKELLSALKQAPLKIARAVDTNVKAKHILISGAVAIALSLTPFTAFVAPVAWGVFGSLCGAKLLARVVLNVHATRERERVVEAANNTRNSKRARNAERDRSYERVFVERGLPKPGLPALTEDQKTYAVSQLSAIHDAVVDFRGEIRDDMTREQQWQLFRAKLRDLHIDFASLSKSLQQPGAKYLLRDAGFAGLAEQRLARKTLVDMAKTNQPKRSNHRHIKRKAPHFSSKRSMTLNVGI